MHSRSLNFCKTLAGGVRNVHALNPGRTGVLQLLFSSPSSSFSFSSNNDIKRRGSEPLLFTPGPLTTSQTVKNAMMRDLGSRDPAFIRIVSDVRKSLLAMAATPSSRNEYDSILMQGSGTFGVEAMIGTLVPRKGAKLLVAINGAYGDRMVSIAKTLGIDVVIARFHEKEPVTIEGVLQALRDDELKKNNKSVNPHTSVTHVAVVHHETTAGVLNDIDLLGKKLNAYDPNIVFMVDSMSAFGAYPVSMKESHIHAVVSSSNKCIEGVPGFSFAVVNKHVLNKSKDNARSVSLDLAAQAIGLNATGQFRFTPPTHSLLAFAQAVKELDAEGGTKARLARYQANHKALVDGMSELGFQSYVTPGAAHQGCIITTFLVPDDAKYVFEDMYNALETKGFVIYPGKTTKVDSFRLGNIGRLFPEDMKKLVSELKTVFEKAGIKLPVKQKSESMESEKG